MDGKLYYTINEVAEMLGVNASQLRFWETEFDCIKPTKTAKGSRRYTQKDIELLQRILYLTRDCGYTLEGARAQLRKADNTLDDKVQLANNLKEIRQFLVELKEEI